MTVAHLLGNGSNMSLHSAICSAELGSKIFTMGTFYGQPDLS